MPPRKPTKSATPAAPVPPPDASHPCYTLLPATLADLPTRPHSPSYHVFFEPTLRSSKTRESSTPPPKKKQKKTEEIPSPLEGAWEAERVQKKLLKWFDEKREERKMPWRKDVVPNEMTKKERSQRGYEVWVSEIMLQQTQVATVISYFERWMEKFPTVTALSKATVDEVNSVWTGLGYYSRAKRLLEGAQTVVRDYKGLVPETVEELLTIEGIGPYSAGAISSIAFGKRSALVDGNVTRVLSRLTALHAPSAAKPTTSFIWSLADSLVPENTEVEDGEDGNKIKNRPGSWNQGLMELGATVCTPKNPKCGECPISEECLGYQESRFIAHRSKTKLEEVISAPVEIDVEDLCTLCSPLPSASDNSKAAHSVEIYPMAKERKKQREEETAVCLVEWESSEIEKEEKDGRKGNERKILVMKRPEKGLLAGLLEFPSIDLPPSSESTSSTRSKQLSTLLKSLLSLPTEFKLSNKAGASAENDLKIESLKTLEPPVVHVYSHIIRTYHVTHLLLTSPSLPRLLPSLATTSKSTSKPSSSKKNKKKKEESDDEHGGDEVDSEPLVQSLPGTGKWIDSSEVEGESLGGAMKKVWIMRQESLGLGTADGKSTKNGKGGGGGKGKAGGKKETVEKGQKSLMGFFGGGAGGAKKVKAKEVAPEESDDDVMIIEEKIEVRKQKIEVKSNGEVEKVEKKVYKKRRIAPASDEEDED
ncbi:hypothetical protein JCM3765_004817 [Sporobolomyces pararoseus]